MSLASEVERGRERGERGSGKQRPLILLSSSSLITPPAGAKRSDKESPIRVIYSRSFPTRDGCYLMAGARTAFREPSPWPKTKNRVGRSDISGNQASICMTLNSVVPNLKTCTIIQRKKTPVVVIQTKVQAQRYIAVPESKLRSGKIQSYPAAYIRAKGTAETCWATWKAALWEEKESKNLLGRTRR
ncbi:hypothetical protein MUK42_12436 [Musa troglodytarum]|uniref:Uncharacterized protein n=1 Tax=Musa troglodytarum TaxID=320322 RepID=A0A9E7GXG9_9LILI|nr:hypothetical protein MUK42_12436 [Musa troglodytarum]URE19857.1 hypothetical protein MUK42_12436 [Musa troglodytarum]